MTKPVTLSAHARERAAQRGATEEQIAATLATGRWEPADRGRRQASQTFAFDAEWQGRLYRRQQVRVVFAEEPDSLVVVTVFVYYFDEEGMG